MPSCWPSSRPAYRFPATRISGERRLVGPGFGWFVGFNLLCCFALASGGETLLLLSPMIGTVLGLNVGSQSLMIFISVLVLLLAGLINVVGVRLTARINNISVGTEILGTLVLGILVLIAFLVKQPAIHSGSFLFTHGPLHGQAPWYAASLALLMGVFTIGGFEACADLGEEAVGVQRTVSRAIIGAVAISGIVGMITLICFAISIPNLSAIASTRLPSPISRSTGSARPSPGLPGHRGLLGVLADGGADRGHRAAHLLAVTRQHVPRLQRVRQSGQDDQDAGRRAGPDHCHLHRRDGVRRVGGHAYVDLIGATPIFASIVYLLIVGAYWRRRHHIPASKAFDLGRWAKPLIIVSMLWEIAIIVDFTLPSIFHAAAQVAIGGQVVGIAWYYLGLRSRLRRGTAGQALALGKLAGKDVLDAAGVGVQAGTQAEPPDGSLSG